MKENLTDLFISQLYKLNNESFDERVIHSVKRCLLDYIGATIAGSKMIQTKANLYLESVSSGNTDSTLIGMNNRTDISNAAFLNGLNSHVAELDDGVMSGIIHPGAPIFSALLPVAEKEKVSSSKIIKAAIVGYEAAVRLADAVQPSHKEIGFHATGTCGAIGAAVAIAALLDFSIDNLKHAFSTAAISGYGTLKVLEDGSELKPFNVAKAANAGLVAAYMAKAGIKGSDDVLSGERGWLSMMSKTSNPSALFEKRNNQLAIERTYFKPYAACRYCHPSIDAAIILRDKIDCVNIASVKILTYQWAVSKHDHTQINGISSAKMSIPFSFALALIKGKANIDDYSLTNINDSQISELTGKIDVKADEELTNLFPEKSAVIVTVFLKNGEKFKERIELAKGEPDNPMTDIELTEKFEALALYGNKSQNTIKNIIDSIWNFDAENTHINNLIK